MTDPNTQAAILRALAEHVAAVQLDDPLADELYAAGLVSDEEIATDVVVALLRQAARTLDAAPPPAPDGERLFRVCVDIGYVGRAHHVDQLKDALYEDLMNAVKYDELHEWIEVEPAPDATPDDIADWLLELEDEDGDADDQADGE